MEIKDIEFEEGSSGINELREFIQEDKGAFFSLEIEDGFRPHSIESELEPQQEPEFIEHEEKQKVPDEWIRLLSVYFKDVASESLLTPNEVIEISVKIEKCEARAREIKSVVMEKGYQSVYIG